ncbi:tetratricopeptide repeat protein [Terracoccus luteus]|uniref:Tetratricopeptide (TPR) repeat protein n=1 Tax=Terracoccus luteus TaxID=53356 RepID=A0A839PKY4_9MICO|nr:tetratricopeptide repeat protein [Terracoccus luteus]MBB2984910.1 tetratricopeptide (TPR) repeat protein [Terracoccus luteus]MCP2170562.1 tetratricopeptide (TPR) repeat protein [Terracoccus luteus]
MTQPSTVTTPPPRALGTDPTSPAPTASGRSWRDRLSRMPGRRRRALPPHLAARRRRLLLGSLPVTVLLALVALRLLTLNPVHDRTLAAYTAGDVDGTTTWGERQGWVNVVEGFRAPFALGDAQVLAGRFEQARPYFEQALEEVPKGGIDECKVRVNLGLTYEALGDAAKAAERETEWRQFYDKGITTMAERPPLCDAPEGGDSGQRASDAQQRMEQKSEDQQQGQEPQQPQEGQGEQPQPQPQPDSGQQPTPEQQERLRQQQQRNTAERNQQQDDDSRNQNGGGGGPAVPKPW